MLNSRTIRSSRRIGAAGCAVGAITVLQCCITAASASSQTVLNVPRPRSTPLHGHGKRPLPFASPGPTGATVDGVSLALQPQAAPYHVGGQMYFGLYTVNGTSKPASFRSRTELRFEVTGASGMIRHQSYGLHSFDRAGVYNREVGIPIGNSSASASDLSETYDITEPGTYQVRALLTLHGSHATVVSPWVTVTVVPKGR